MYLIIDLECTCWDKAQMAPSMATIVEPEMEIIEIGGVLLDDNCEVIDEFQTYVNPISNPILSDFCKNLTHITQEQVDTGMNFVDAMNVMKSWCREFGTSINDVIFVSWGMFDQFQFRRDCKLHGINYPFGIHRSFKHEFEIDRGLDYCNLTEALQIACLPWEGTLHSGIDDAKNTARLFIKERTGRTISFISGDQK